MDLQARRCGCGAIFKLATLRARETECTTCQRTRVDTLTKAALVAGKIGVVRDSTGLAVDYRDPRGSWRQRVSTKFQDVADPRGVVRPGQFFETRNEAELACPADWYMYGQVQGGYRVFPPGHDHLARKPMPAEARPAPVDLRVQRNVSERITIAAQLLEERKLARAELDRMGKAFQVIADRRVPTGQVFMTWTDEGGHTIGKTLKITRKGETWEIIP